MSMPALAAGAPFPPFQQERNRHWGGGIGVFKKKTETRNENE
jgi:hypothetical protein